MNNNLYLVASNDKITLDNKLQEIIKKSSDAEIVHYDLSEVAIGKQEPNSLLIPQRNIALERA